MQAEAHAFDWTLGDRIRKARRAAGLSHAQLAEALTERGFTSSAGRIGAWETSDKQPREMERILEAISEITGAPLDWLATGFHNRRNINLSIVPPILGQLKFDYSPPTRSLTPL